MDTWKLEKKSDTHRNVYDNNQKLVGNIDLGTNFYSLDKKGLIKKKELFIRQVNMTFRDIDNTVEVKSSCHLNQSTLMYDVFKRTFTYTKYGKTHEFEMEYHNNPNSAKYYYSFNFENDSYYVFFDNRYFNLEMFKNHEYVGKWEQTNRKEFKYEVAESFKEHKWLWLSIFNHLYSHFPRASSNYFVLPESIDLD